RHPTLRRPERGRREGDALLREDAPARRDAPALSPFRLRLAAKQEGGGRVSLRAGAGPEEPAPGGGAAQPGSERRAGGYGAGGEAVPAVSGPLAGGGADQSSDRIAGGEGDPEALRGQGVGTGAALVPAHAGGHGGAAHGPDGDI